MLAPDSRWKTPAAGSSSAECSRSHPRALAGGSGSEHVHDFLELARAVGDAVVEADGLPVQRRAHGEAALTDGMVDLDDARGRDGGRQAAAQVGEVVADLQAEPRDAAGDVRERPEAD